LTFLHFSIVFLRKFLSLTFQKKKSMAEAGAMEVFGAGVSESKSRDSVFGQYRKLKDDMVTSRSSLCPTLLRATSTISVDQARRLNELKEEYLRLGGDPEDLE
jgi:hypothetical protein